MTDTPQIADTLGVRDAIMTLPEQIDSALDAFADVPGLGDPARIENVLLLGMGDSGFGGDVAAACARPFSSRPLVVYNGYLPPSWVNSNTLVIAMSRSGTTEETLESLEAAVEAGAALVTVTGGGDLADLARRYHAPVLPVVSEAVMPRTILGLLAVPAMLVLEQLGLFPGARSWLTEAADVVRARRDDLLASNAAVEIAERIGSTIPVVYGGGAIGTTAAKRWKVALNHNAKMPAFWAPMPELCHNELVGWGGDPERNRDQFTQIQLRHDAEHPQTSFRFEFLRSATTEAMHDIVEVEARGDGPAAQLFDLIFVGDVVSLEAAALRGVDPGPLPEVEALKFWLDDPR